MNCPRCQHENPAGMRFCGQCAAPLAAACSACGSVNPPGTRFCGQCAARLPSAAPGRLASPDSYTPRHLAEKILTSKAALEGERKHVTVLFVDVSGFTSLSETLDPEDVHRLMTRAFDLMLREVHRFEGTVNQFLGDGIMALFGAPLAHEDHAQRAAHAALAIRKAIEGYHDELQARGISFRVRQGLNTGLVVVGSIGSDLRMDYTALGDTTNIAARLQQLASPGAIFAAEATHRDTREAFEWHAVGPMAVKGKPDPIPIYELLGPRAVKSRFEATQQRGLTRFVGRDADLDKLMAAWARARHGRGQVVSVTGEAGIGKSRLLHEFKRRLTHDGARCIEGSCFAYGVVISYLPFLEIVKEIFGLEATTAEAEAKRRIVLHLTSLELDPTAVAPYLQNLLAFTVDDALFPQLTSHLVRQRTVEALKTLLLAEATRHPCVLLVEDVHWIDQATEEALAALIGAMGTVPLLLVLAYRPEYVRAWMEHGAHTPIDLVRLPSAISVEMVGAILTKPYASSVPLQQLSPEQSHAMVQDLLRTATLPPELAQLIARNTDGNPFFVEELTRSLLENGDLVRTSAGYAVQTSLAALALPTTVQGVLLARIDRLHEDLKAVLQVASVIGRVFTHPVLARVAPREVDLEAALPKLADLEFIGVTAVSPLREYSFKHVLTQEAVYRTRLRPKREESHESIGAALEALYPERLEEYSELLAYHYVRSGNKDKAVEYLDLANRKAAKANAMPEAKAYFDDAMKLLDAMPKVEMNRRRGLSLLGKSRLGDERAAETPGVLRGIEQVRVDGGHPGRSGASGRALRAHGMVRVVVRPLRSGHPDYRQGHGALCCHGEHRRRRPGLCALAMEPSVQGRVPSIPGQEGRRASKPDGLDESPPALFAVGGASIAYTWLGRWDQAVQEAQKGLRAGEEVSDNSIISLSAWALALAYTAKGDLARAMEYGELGVQKAPTPGDKTWASCVVAATWCRVGDAPRGIAVLSQAVSVLRAARFIWSEVCALWLAEGYALAGEHEQARRALEELLDSASRHGMKFLIGCAHRLLGEIALRTNPAQVEAPLAAPHFDHSLAILQEIEAENELALAYASYGRLHHQQGNVAKSRECLTRAIEIFERLGTSIEPDRLRRALAEVSEG